MLSRQALEQHCSFYGVSPQGDDEELIQHLLGRPPFGFVDPSASSAVGGSNSTNVTTTGTSRRQEESDEASGIQQKVATASVPTISKCLSKSCQLGNKPSNTANTSAPKATFWGLVGKELICPITLELPVDPVIAEDGRVYERQSILQHIKSNTGKLRSPVTNLPMGPSLFTSQPIKNIIMQAIKNGEIVGALVDAWNQRQNEIALQKQMIEIWKQQALVGNGDSAVELGMYYQFGKFESFVDREEALRWWKIAALAGEVEGWLMYGTFLLYNEGSNEQEQLLGLDYLLLAAANDFKPACLQLGSEYASGEIFPQNYVLAVKFLQQGLAPSTNNNTGRLRLSEH
jgi:hypothetical protein